MIKAAGKVEKKVPACSPSAQLMEASNNKFQKVCSFLMLSLLLSLIVTAENAPDCCRQRTCSCRIYDLLHGSGNHAAGILTLGKRKSSSPAMQTRLYRLLHGSGNHAAGILTMGKRGESDTDNQVPGNAGRASLRTGAQFAQTQPGLPGCTMESKATSHRECREQFFKNCRQEQTTVPGN